MSARRFARRFQLSCCGPTKRATAAAAAATCALLELERQQQCARPPFVFACLLASYKTRTIASGAYENNS